MPDEASQRHPLTPCAPPRMLDDVYADGCFETMLGIAERHGPWPTILARHFDSFDEVIASISGTVPADHGMTLDDIASPHFRGYLAQNSTVLYPEMHDIFYDQRLIEIVKDYWGCAYARPTLMLFNICGPHHSTPAAHLDSTTFRGVRIENTPVWLQNIMAKSGLFTDYIVKMAQVITWWYRGEEGTFTYWPDGPYEPPARLQHPLWNRGLVVQSELMFHRGDSVGRRDERRVRGVKARSMLHHDAGDGTWHVTTDGETVHRYEPDQIRFLAHWNAELYRDQEELEKVMDHSDDLTHDIVFDTLMADLAARDVAFTEPSDPLKDPAWINTLVQTYSVEPTTDWPAA